jgi:FMN phosphatase YigB (HAD superfamily)
MSELVIAVSRLRPGNKIKAAYFDGDGVIIHMPKEHSHELAAKIHGVDLCDINDELFGRRYNEWLRGQRTFDENINYLRSVWGENDPRTLVAESVNISITPEEINYPLIEAIQPFRQQGMLVAMATVQGIERFTKMQQLLQPHFDRFYATCEMQVLKVEDGTQSRPDEFFSMLLGGLSLAPEQVAFFDDRPDNIDSARSKGINAHIYESPEQVARILSL